MHTTRCDLAIRHDGQFEPPDTGRGRDDLDGRLSVAQPSILLDHVDLEQRPAGVDVVLEVHILSHF